MPGLWNNRVGVGLGLGNNRETIENNALMASSDQPDIMKVHAHYKHTSCLAECIPTVLRPCNYLVGP